MHDKYLYAMIDAFGACWTVIDGGTEKVEGLPSLMRQGWRPLRETAFHNSAGTGYILILLERE
jgi:hypothetical protein